MRRLSVAAALLLLSCAPRTGADATVSGKTVYRGMGVEGVAIEVQRLESGGWVRDAAVRSGYHGSFVARLRPGRYRLSARTGLPAARGGTVWLLGTLEGLDVSPGTRRLDRLVVVLAPPERPGGGGP